MLYLYAFYVHLPPYLRPYPATLPVPPLRVCGEHGRYQREAEVAHLHAGGSHTVDGCTITRARGALVSVWRMAPLVRDLDAHAGALPCQVGDAPAARGAWAADLVRLGFG